MHCSAVWELLDAAPRREFGPKVHLSNSRVKANKKKSQKPFGILAFLGGAGGVPFAKDASAACAPR